MKTPPVTAGKVIQRSVQRTPSAAARAGSAAAREAGMRKKDIAAHVAAETGLTKRDAAAAVNAVFGCMSEALLGGETVQVAHFGTFAVSPRAAGAGRDFRTGARVRIPPTKRAVFRAGTALRDGLNAPVGG